MEQLSEYSKYTVIPINEAFTPLLAIEKLCTLNLSKAEECSMIYFNVTLLPSQVRISICIAFICVKIH